jgi:hypothetical protein
MENGLHQMENAFVWAPTLIPQGSSAKGEESQLMKVVDEEE